MAFSPHGDAKSQIETDYGQASMFATHRKAGNLSRKERHKFVGQSQNWTNDGDSGDIHIDEAVAIFKMKSPLRTNKNDYPQ